MNTRRAVGLLLMLTALLVCQSAWAFYNPHTGKWLSRDPIGEKGGPNIYALVRNRPSIALDTNGQGEAAPLLDPWIEVLPDPDDPPTGQPWYGTKPGPWLLLAVAPNDKIKEACKTFLCPHSNLDQCLDCCDLKHKQFWWFSKGMQIACYCKCWELYPPTKRVRTKPQLIAGWEALNPGQSWPSGAVAHHVWPLADGGIDDGSNIIPIPAGQHQLLHTFNGDYVRWGQRSCRQCPPLPAWLPDPED